jgi:hypothetical protein
VATSTVTLGTAAAEAALTKVPIASSLLAWLPGGKVGAVLATSIGLASGGVVVAVTHQHGSSVPVPPRAASMHVVHGAPLMASVPLPTSAEPSAVAAAAADSTLRSVNMPGTPAVRSKLTIGDETRLLAQVQQALRTGDGALALMLLGQYRRDFGQGALVEEASAAEVFAQCAVGNVAQAGRLAQRFLRRFPGSPLQPRVEASCAAKNGEP